jgi:hypothetical protein
MPQCQKQVLSTGLNFNRLRQCRNFAVEGSVYCHTHRPDKPKPIFKRDPYKTALYVASLRRKRIKREEKENATTE